MSLPRFPTLRSGMAAALGGLAAACSPAAPAASVEDWGGRYEHVHENALVDGETFTSTDVLEVLPLGEDRAVVRANLEFFNGHLCHIAGVARLEGDALVYRAAAGSVYEGCELRLTRSEGRLGLLDVGDSCRPTACGARGAFDDWSAALDTRQPLDEEAFRADPEIVEAMAEGAGEAK